jgi:hypothetical protein
MKNVLIVLAALTAAVVGALSAQVFPIKWDDPGASPEPLLSHQIDAIRLDGVWFNELDATPFTCDASTVGVVYLQKDLTGAIGGRDHALCLCGKEDSATYIWRNLAGSQDCTSAVP